MDNPYSMNVIELCPVGALTSQDFRFKARVWDMSFNDSISFADGSGANTSIGVRNNEILRIQPRTNMYVNKHWLTDEARLNYIEFVNTNRITEPNIRINGGLEKTDWADAITKTADALNKFKPNEIYVITSSKATNESNYLMQKFANSILKTPNMDFLHHIDKSKEDGFLSVADRAPNTHGAREVGATSINGVKTIDLAEKIKTGEIKAIIAMEEDFTDFPELLNSLSQLDLLVAIHYNNNALTNIAHIVLPASTYAETEGTYTNVKDRVQHFKSVLKTKENMRYMGLNMSRLDKFGALNDRWTQHEVRNCRMSWRIVKDLANAMGANWQYFKSENVFDEIEKTVPAFKGMSYHLLDEFQGIQFNKASSPDPKLNNYVSHVMKPH
ncbi:MAG: molybdopterin-dependent oxidoreductase [Candidatus Kapabacteria bacterium]|nr:molybdopterin-dependent oxidoreductase [Candidatus Kapabacteria bacterium]